MGDPERFFIDPKHLLHVELLRLSYQFLLVFRCRVNVPQYCIGMPTKTTTDKLTLK